MKRLLAVVTAAVVGCGGGSSVAPVKHDPKYDVPQEKPPKGQKPTIG